MNRGTLVAAVALLAAAALAGCAPSAGDSVRAVAAPEPAAVYNASRGIKLTPFAREFVRLETADFIADRVPASAVLRTVQGTFVYVQNGTWFLRTPVTLGAPSADGTSFALRRGLLEGDRMVTGGVRSLWLAELHFLRAGQACTHDG